MSSIREIVGIRRLHLMGLLQQFVSHDVMNSLTKAVINLDCGELEKTKTAIYQSATALQELQLLGSPESGFQSRKTRINDLLKNSFSLTSGLFRDHQVLVFEDFKDSSEAMVCGQVQIIAMLEILLSVTKSLRLSEHRSLFTNILSVGTQLHINFIVSGSDIDFTQLELQESWGIGLAKKIIEIDLGSCWIERDPASYRICVQFPKLRIS